MIECNNCESPMFLHITKSNVTINHDTISPTEITEEYECTTCGGTGAYYGSTDASRPSLTGDVRYIGGRHQAGLLWP